MKEKLIILILFLQLSYFGISQIATKYSNEFLSIGVGGRALSMGNSTIATVNDATAVYWNPAALVELENRFNIVLMHSEYFASIAKYDFIGINYKIDTKSAIALSMIRFGVDDIPNTLNLFDSDGNIHYDRISSFSTGDYAFIASYSRKLSIEGLSIGGNIKIIHRKAGNFASAWGFGIDLAAKYYYKNWKFAANIKDITSTFNAWNFNKELLKETFDATGNKIPENGLEITLPKILLGFAHDFKIKNQFYISPEICFPITTDGKRNTLIKTNFISIDPAVGIEFSYKKIIFVRTGINNFQSISDFDEKKHFSCEPNLGVGLKYKWFTLDYALTNIGSQGVSLYSNVFSLSIAFDAQKKVKSI